MGASQAVTSSGQTTARLQNNTHTARLLDAMLLMMVHTGDTHLITSQATTQSVQSASSVPTDMHSMEEVGQLVLKLSQAGKTGDVFKLFAKHVSDIVPGLTHLRCAKRFVPRMARTVHLSAADLTLAHRMPLAVAVHLQCLAVTHCQAKSHRHKRQQKQTNWQAPTACKAGLATARWQQEAE